MKLTYTAPTARDLSTLSVQGGVDYLCNAGLVATPEGCTSGGSPDGTCTQGVFVGAVDQPCTSGSSPATLECVSGTGATVGASCLSGAAV